MIIKKIELVEISEKSFESFFKEYYRDESPLKSINLENAIEEFNLYTGGVETKSVKFDFEEKDKKKLLNIIEHIQQNSKEIYKKEVYEKIEFHKRKIEKLEEEIKNLSIV